MIITYSYRQSAKFITKIAFNIHNISSIYNMWTTVFKIHYFYKIRSHMPGEGFEPSRPFGQGIFLPHHVAIAIYKICCGLDYIITLLTFNKLNPVNVKFRLWVYSLYTFKGASLLEVIKLHIFVTPHLARYNPIRTSTELAHFYSKDFSLGTQISKSPAATITPPGH